MGIGAKAGDELGVRRDGGRRSGASGQPERGAARERADAVAEPLEVPDEPVGHVDVLRSYDLAIRAAAEASA